MLIKLLFFYEGFVLENEVKLVEGVLVSLPSGSRKLIASKGGEHGDTFKESLIEAACEPVGDNELQTVRSIFGLDEYFFEKIGGVFEGVIE